MATITYTVTVAYDGTANIYYLDGSPKPALTFVRGNTYEFDLSNSSNSGHPLAFKNSAGSSYTTGVTTTGTAGSSGAKVSIVINATTPSQLRYYCTVHGNYMGNIINVPAVDAYNGLYGDGHYGKAIYGVVYANQALTGVSATGAIAPVQINGFEIDVSEKLDSVSSTGSIGTLTHSNTHSIASVVGTTSIGTVGVGASGNILSAAGTGLVGSVQVDISEVLTGVSATFSVNASGLDIRSINRVDITGSPMAGTIGTVSPNIDEPIATGTQGTTASSSVQVNIAEKVVSVSATGGVGSLGHSNTVTLVGVEGTTAVQQVQLDVFEIDVSEKLDSVFATGAVGSLTLHTTAGLTGVVGTFSVGNPTETGVITTFTATAYDRRNVANTLPKQTSSQRRAA